MQQISNRGEATRWLVITVDLIVVNTLYNLFTHVGLIPAHSNSQLWWNVAYIFSVFCIKPVAHLRLAKSEEVVSCSFWTVVMMTAIFVSEQSLSGMLDVDWSNVFWRFLCSFIVFTIFRFVSRTVIKLIRTHGRDRKTAVFVGAGVNLAALYDRMAYDKSTGYTISGYFEDKDSRHLSQQLPRLGTRADVIKYLENHHPDMLFCNLPSSEAESIRTIMDYCDNHLIHFYSVPNVRNYVQRAMAVEFVDDIPVLSVRYEPLRRPVAIVTKRMFDILFSLAFLLFFFWWIFIIVSVITKITMPGPVFFKQKRNGLYGKEFTCLKFRSMKVNADADTKQATENDPRKTKWGNIMRRTNIDELPQFINVLLGDMSIVGPRPHMVKHTEEYRALINKYMVRHFAKPGITGLAQVTGWRGETSELWMMEERIRKDIWYVENWSLLLDIKIIFRTITNMLGFEKGNAY